MTSQRRLVTLLLAASAATLSAQATAVFEAASIKPNMSASRSSSVRFLPGGRLQAVNVPLRSLIVEAYLPPRWARMPAVTITPRTPIQIVQGTSPLLDQRFDIMASADSDITRPANTNTVGPMNYALQRLLADRFHLSIHREKQPTHGYSISLARADGRLGPDLRRSVVDCIALRAARAPDPRRPDGSNLCVITGSNRTDDVRGIRVRAGGHTLVQFAAHLEMILSAPVEDRTALNGPFDIDLTYGGFANLVPRAEPPGVIRATDLETAMREQLGLKLEEIRTEVEVIVVDHVEPPTDN